ncbi:hypothetical protein M409DRAFT_57998 [Zasmidium cellare ATCC 36951]|uniref:Uncharacterized protein n=1 Tax=Zasmidium cellare ATCC 36951 TaxID=1080233 RepID=A0A6A6C9P8_ZASCE|nr:uncharacterized protein M409DRAFT_57998 [Zasmidium cellare ATCC 36951]KAF2162960.1 hypothetical protein M409DRAFT_57998 [Zasmidium cellare ATCC 36951]
MTCDRCSTEEGRGPSAIEQPWPNVVGTRHAFCTDIPLCRWRYVLGVGDDIVDGTMKWEWWMKTGRTGFAAMRSAFGVARRVGDAIWLCSRDSPVNFETSSSSLLTPFIFCSSLGFRASTTPSSGGYFSTESAMQCSGNLPRTPHSVLESGPPISKKSFLYQNHQPGRLASQHDALLVIGCDWHTQLSKLSQAQLSSIPTPQRTCPSSIRASDFPKDSASSLATP